MGRQKLGQQLSALASGLVFGIGMAISGMTNTERVQGFLDLAGAWDPTLAFVMGGGLIVTAIGYKYVLKSPSPIFADAFHLPTKTNLDKALLIGAVIFGAGWGLVGYCPGPAIAGLSYAYPTTLLFVPTMLAGLLLARVISKHI